MGEGKEANEINEAAFGRKIFPKSKGQWLHCSMPGCNGSRAWLL